MPDEVRTATEADLDGLTATLTAAFEHDPLWSWAFPDRDDLEAVWRLFVRNALRYPCVRVSGEYDAVAVWIPPGGSELTETGEAEFERLVRDLIGPRAGEVLELVERFDAAHPEEPPHYYLSLLGTHPGLRGRGLGMALLADSLAGMDAEGVSAYLESSNPANDARYERLGFRRQGEFTTPDGAHLVGTMWRDAGGGRREP
jgi:ribosomal protein S18 acetylase RimI-like enzyme